ncbi:hypothetical protein UY3_08071 [Chelonia mydas]|uniref:Uncharacterized protein n=1 Tax=Chelonia mydas TaxID=8469 RepID=M7BC75_CHEMY|nr:hypothetical protein UY3_08071 [Chelonia mydas]
MLSSVVTPPPLPRAPWILRQAWRRRKEDLTEKTVIDEEVELDDDVELLAGSPGGAGSQEPFTTLEVSTQSQKLLSGELEAGEEMPGEWGWSRGRGPGEEPEQGLEQRAAAQGTRKCGAPNFLVPYTSACFAYGSEEELHWLIIAGMKGTLTLSTECLAAFNVAHYAEGRQLLERDWNLQESSNLGNLPAKASSSGSQTWPNSSGS